MIHNSKHILFILVYSKKIEKKSMLNRESIIQRNEQPKHYQ